MLWNFTEHYYTEKRWARLHNRCKDLYSVTQSELSLCSLLLDQSAENQFNILRLSSIYWDSVQEAENQLSILRLSGQCIMLRLSSTICFSFLRLELRLFFWKLTVETDCTFAEIKTQSAESTLIVLSYFTISKRAESFCCLNHSAERWDKDLRKETLL